MTKQRTMRSVLVATAMAVWTVGGWAVAGESAQPGTTRTARLAIDRMACSSCAAQVTQALQGLDGVKAARVGLAEKGATVEYDPAKVTPQQMAEAVNRAGFKASVNER